MATRAEFFRKAHARQVEQLRRERVLMHNAFERAVISLVNQELGCKIKRWKVTDLTHRLYYNTLSGLNQLEPGGRIREERKHWAFLVNVDKDTTVLVIAEKYVVWARNLSEIECTIFVENPDRETYTSLGYRNGTKNSNNAEEIFSGTKISNYTELQLLNGRWRDGYQYKLETRISWRDSLWRVD